MFRRRKKEDEKKKEEEVVLEQPRTETVDIRDTTDIYTTPAPKRTASEDALLIKIEEEIRGQLERDGKILKLDKSGKLSVKNLGETDRIFDIDVKLGHLEGIEGLNEEFEIAELDPQQEWSQEYTVSEATESDLPFKFEERVNTNPYGDESSTVLTFGHEMDVAITLQFSFERPLDALTLEKDLPTGLENMQVTECSLGNAEIDFNKLKWTMNSVSAGDTASCTFSGRINVNDINPRPTGNTTISFSGKGEDTTKLQVQGADGYVRCRIYIESDERDEEPDTWDNRLVIENRSEFPVELREVHVSDDDGTYLNVILEENDVIIPAGDRWESDSWEKLSPDLPMFKKSVKYTIKPEIVINALGTLDVPEGQLAVAYGTGEKAYSQTVFPSYRETPVEVITNVCNSGSVTFNELVIEDEVPAYFQPSDLSDVKVLVKSQASAETEEETAEEPIELSPDDYQLSLEPDYAEVTDRKKIICKITRTIEPQSCVILQYNATVTKPPADVQFESNPIAHAVLAEPAPTLDIPIKVELEKLQVVHLRRRLTWAKDVIPRAQAGQYEILLYFKNRSNTDIEHIELRDLIPHGFSLVEDDSSIQSEVVESNDEGEIRQWVIEKLEPSEDIEIRYVLEGKGTYRGKELLVSY